MPNCLWTYLGIIVEWYSQYTYCIAGDVGPVSVAWSVCCSIQYVHCISHNCINLAYMSFHLHLNAATSSYCCLEYSCSLIHMLHYCLCTVTTGRCSCVLVNQELVDTILHWQSNVYTTSLCYGFKCSSGFSLHYISSVIHWWLTLYNCC
jgi:hypothetical protein